MSLSADSFHNAHLRQEEQHGGKALLFNIISLLVLLFLLTIVYYFNGISDKTYQLLKLIILLISIFIQSFSLGKRRDNKRRDKAS